MKKIVELWKNTNIVIKIIIIFIIIAIFGILSIYKNYINNKNNIESINGEIVEGNDYISSYEINQAGFYRDSQIIIEEKFNDKNDLIYSKYRDSNGEIIEDNYTYSYDEQDRITKVDYNNGESTITIKYAQKYISQITTDYDIGKYEYNYIYRPDNSVVIECYFTSYKTVGNVKANSREYYKGYIITTKTINNKNYCLMSIYDDKNNLEEQKIYEEDFEKKANSLLHLGFVPIQYANGINATFNNTVNIIQPYVGFIGTIPIINYGCEINSYLKNNTNEKIFDQKGRILSDSGENYSSDNYTLFLYKYEYIDEKSYYQYGLVDGGKYYSALGLEQQYCTEINKVYLDTNDNVYKVEIIEDDNYINGDEFIKLKEEYTEYLNKNKVDTSDVINAFLENGNETNNNAEIEDSDSNSNTESNSTSQNEVKELSYEEKKTIAKEKLDGVNIHVDNGEDDTQETYFSPLNYNISTSYSIDDTIDFKIEKVVVVNEQTGVSQEIVNNSDSTYMGNVSIDLMDGQNKIVFSFYDNYGNIRQIIKNVNKLNF